MGPILQAGTRESRTQREGVVYNLALIWQRGQRRLSDTLSFKVSFLGDACRLLKHLSYARTTRDFEARGLDGARRDLDEYHRASARTFRHILMNCSLLLSLTGIRQRLPNPLPDPGLWL